jgi:hypothetical protein
MKMYNQKLIVQCFFAVAIYAAMLTLVCFRYKSLDYRDLLFLTQCTTENSVIEHFGRPPEIVYHQNDKMPHLGWKLPKRKISNKVLVYTNRSALRFYVYVDNNGEVEYVFTSNS